MSTRKSVILCATLSAGAGWAMKIDVRPQTPRLSVLDEPEVCGECNSGSRLSNGLCLHCLLNGALENETGSSAGKRSRKRWPA